MASNESLVTESFTIQIIAFGDGESTSANRRVFFSPTFIVEEYCGPTSTILEPPVLDEIVSGAGFSTRPEITASFNSVNHLCPVVSHELTEGRNRDWDFTDNGDSFTLVLSESANNRPGSYSFTV